MSTLKKSFLGISVVGLSLFLIQVAQSKQNMQVTDSGKILQNTQSGKLLQGSTPHLFETVSGKSLQP